MSYIANALFFIKQQQHHQQQQQQQKLHNFHNHQLKGSLTSHGELCTDGCEKRGYPYFWCHKVKLFDGDDHDDHDIDNDHDVDDVGEQQPWSMVGF